MREIVDLEQTFAEFEVHAAPTFRPPGMAAARRQVRNRRRRHGLLAGVVALLLAGPAGAYAMAGRNDQSTPPTPGPETIRQFALPQGIGRAIDLQFLNAWHGWALYDGCAPGTDTPRSGDCRRTLARTTDGGETWQTRPLTATEGGPGMVYLLPVDARTVTVVDRNRFLTTTDGGLTFTTHPIGSPPLVAQQSIATSGGFLLRCPDGNMVGSVTYHLRAGVTDANGGEPCQQQVLARLSTGPTPTQPPTPLHFSDAKQLIEGADGRLWLSISNGDGLTVLLSNDAAATWRQLPTPSGAAQLLLSPDGHDVWLFGDGPGQHNGSAMKRMWQLVGDRWQERIGLPADTTSTAVINGGVLVAISADGNLTYWTAGHRMHHTAGPVSPSTFVNGDEHPTIQVLPDDTILIATRTVTTLGTGTAHTRTWTRLTH